jgi:hypothetical protein
MDHDPLFELGRNDLERLKLATVVILAEAAESSGIITDPLESELVILKERLDKALMLPQDTNRRTIA